MSTDTNLQLITSRAPFRDKTARVRSEVNDRGYRTYKIPATVPMPEDDHYLVLADYRSQMVRAGARFYDVGIVTQRNGNAAYVVTVRPILSLTK